MSIKSLRDSFNPLYWDSTYPILIYPSEWNVLSIPSTGIRGGYDPSTNCKKDLLIPSTGILLRGAACLPGGSGGFQSPLLGFQKATQYETQAELFHFQSPLLGFHFIDFAITVLERVFQSPLLGFN